MADLEGRGFELVRHDLAKERPSRELLSRLIKEQGLERVLNTRSPSWKALGIEVSSLTPSRAIDMMMEEPNLIRRPLVLTKSRAILGYDTEEYDSL